MVAGIAEYLNGKAAAEYLGISESLFYRAVAPDPTLPRTMVGKRAARWRKADLDAWSSRHAAARG